MENSTSYLNILDTAIKIGLGAMIGGIATYFLNKQKNAIDKEKSSLAKKINYIEQILEKTEKARFNLDKAAHIIWVNDDEKDIDYKKCAEIYLDCISLLGQSRSISELIDLKGMDKKFEKTEEIIFILYQAAAEKKLLDDTDELNKKIEDYQSLIRDIFKSLAENFKTLSIS